MYNMCVDTRYILIYYILLHYYYYIIYFIPIYTYTISLQHYCNIMDPCIEGFAADAATAAATATRRRSWWGGGRSRVQTPCTHMTTHARYTSSNQTSACSSGPLTFTTHQSFYIINNIVISYFDYTDHNSFHLSYSLRLHTHT